MELLEMKTKFDFNKALDGSRNISVIGIPNTTNRKNLIEKAILRIQEDPENAFSDEYIGMKNYAHFGDQEVCCEYGMRPRHGSVVFQIGRANGRHTKSTLGENEIFFLECVRDFGFVEIDDKKINLNQLFNKIVKLAGEWDEYVHALKDFEVESHI